MVKLFKSDWYAIVSTIIAILFIVHALYNKIRYDCLKKASEQIANVEKMNQLTGRQKFDLVISWILNDLPSIFRSSLVKNAIELLVQYVYDNSHIYMKNYVKRKTGYDITELIEKTSERNSESPDDI